YHPKLMIKIWFYGYATKTHSSRKVEEKTHTDVAFIYLAGMQKPDFKAIAEFRRKYISELTNSFVDILQICHRLGLTKLGNISIDSKVMKASATSSRTYDEKELIKEREEIQKAIDKYLEKVNQTDLEEDNLYGPDNRGDELPENIRNKENRIKKMKRIVHQLKQAQEKLKQSHKKKINLTDEDAQFQKDKSRIIPGYRAEIAVDSKEQIIVANDVTDGQNDVPQLIPMVDEVLENVKELEPEKFSDDKQPEKINIPADAGYSSGKNLAELEKPEYKEKVEPYIPDTNSRTKERGKGYDVNSPFHRSKFIYNKEENNFTCPAGKKLHYNCQTMDNGVKYSVYNNYKDCKSCQHFGKCTISKNGRFIWISEHQHLIDKMRRKLSTKKGKKIYAKRKITAEPVFGNLSQNLGFREFLLRGLEKVKGEFSLMCSAHNLLKIARFLREQNKLLTQALTKPCTVAIPDG
ncbi:MAG: IS1182 family transposase, partial [Elusimicrobia bacterium]|nr:IS1182 family transposase [Elusimicrobiota bacterium]